MEDRYITKRQEWSGIWRPAIWRSITKRQDRSAIWRSLMIRQERSAIWRTGI